MPMAIVSNDKIFPVKPPSSVDYKTNNPLARLITVLDAVELGPSVRVYLRIGNGTSGKLDVPYNPLTDRYEIEIWGYPGADLRSKLDAKGQAAFDRGGLIANSSLVLGSYTDFAREGLDNRDL